MTRRNIALGLAAWPFLLGCFISMADTRLPAAKRLLPI